MLQVALFEKNIKILEPTTNYTLKSSAMLIGREMGQKWVFQIIYPREGVTGQLFLSVGVDHLFSLLTTCPSANGPREDYKSSTIKTSTNYIKIIKQNQPTTKLTKLQHRTAKQHPLN